jgi:glycosyltransferase involved in cell wall biosynthesis
MQYGFFLKLLTGKKWYVEVGGIPWEEEQGLKKNKFIKKLFTYPLQIADKVIFYSDSIKNSFVTEEKINISNFRIIPCGVNEDIFTIKNKKQLLKEHNLEKDFFYITFIGAIEKWQGLDVLVDTAKYFSQKNIKTKYIIVGDGRYLKALKEKVKNNRVSKYFIFVGAVNQNRVVDYINMADVCIAPFVKERKASPIKIFEYMACGKMVISSKIPDVLNLGLDKGLIYFEPENTDDLLKKIEIVNVDRKNIHQPSEIRELILSRYTWEEISNIIYEEIKYEI